MFFLKKKKILQIFSDGTLNINSVNSLKRSKQILFYDKDFKNSQFYKKNKKILNNLNDNENYQYRKKFLNFNKL